MIFKSAKRFLLIIVETSRWECFSYCTAVQGAVNIHITDTQTFE